ncbi:HLA class II histocompatibility antigen, DR beta 3 chain, partial [Papio anubis]|uniref:HLA class II histocompatibility antigen, DR beta 3 chain n=1 Tax=Papio anubis TaxID=9555 RepID=UPI0012ADAB03
VAGGADQGSQGLHPTQGALDGGVSVSVFLGGHPCDWIVRVPTARFLEQAKCECHIFNGTERVRYLNRNIHKREENLRFHSDLGEFQAVTELERPVAENWNSQKGILEEKRDKVDTYCRYNYRVFESFTEQR